MRVPWVYDGYSFPVNPSTDSGWIGSLIMAEHNPIRRTGSVIQLGGSKSPRRTITGYLIGVYTDEMKTKFETWFRNNTQATLTDHTGGSRHAMITRFDAEPVQNISEWRQGRQTYKYTAEFIEIH